MRILSYLSFSVLLACAAFPATAETQSPYKGGMRNIINQPAEKAPEQKAPEPEMVPVESTGGIRRLVITEEPVEATAEENKEAEETRIWNRYKSLAAGTAQEGEKQSEKETGEPEKEGEADKTASAENTKQGQDSSKAATPDTSSGFGRIIEKYEQNKARQSQMRTIQVEQPKQETSSVLTEEKESETP